MFEITLTIILALFRAREDVKPSDPLNKARPLIGEYHAKVEATCRTLREQDAVEAA